MSPSNFKIPAIILTYDKNRCLTDHMIMCYDNLWPDHPFIFNIPYQSIENKNHENKIFIKSPSSIKATVLHLLSKLNDDDWIYWCIDDKYPIKLDLECMKVISNWILNDSSLDISGLLLCRTRMLLKPENLTGRQIKVKNYSFLERKTLHQIWIHQFIRVKVIRSMFEKFPDEISKPILMDHYKNNQKKDVNHKIYVIENNRAIFGESSEDGQITKNCRQSLDSKGLYIPPWFETPTQANTIIGDDFLITNEQLDRYHTQNNC